MMRPSLLLLLLAAGMQSLVGDEVAKAPNDIAVPRGQRLELINCNAEFVASFYQRYTGKAVKVSPEAEKLKLTLVVPGPLSNADAARFIENQLMLEGFVVQDGRPAEVLIVKGAGAWKMPAKRSLKEGWRPRPDAILVPKGQFFDFPNIDVFTAIRLYHKHTGKRVLMASYLGGIEMSIRKEGPLTNAEATKLLEGALREKGLLLKEFAPDELAVLPINQVVIEELLSKPPAQHPARVRRLPARP